jgi:hypothetical protein
MSDSADSDRSREIEAAWRSGGAHGLAREFVLVARSEGADRQLQEAIAEIVLASEEPPTQDDVAHAMRD